MYYVCQQAPFQEGIFWVEMLPLSNKETASLQMTEKTVSRKNNKCTKRLGVHKCVIDEIRDLCTTSDQLRGSSIQCIQTGSSMYRGLGLGLDSYHAIAEFTGTYIYLVWAPDPSYKPGQNSFGCPADSGVTSAG